MEVEKQVLIIWTVTNGLADDIAVEDLKRFEDEAFKFVENSHPAVLETLRDEKIDRRRFESIDERSDRRFQSNAVE